MNTKTMPGITGFTKLAFLGCALLAADSMQNTALAQGDEAAEIEEIVVTGIRRSLDVAADIKRESDTVIDAITAQDIGLFSDNNVGEALARVPGVLLEREAGEGYRVSVRGLGPRFVRTTINGRTALSASGGETGGGDDARGFTFNIMPSEVISKATVSKSTQAWEIEGGIGGVVDLTTARPLELKPDGDDFYFSGTLRGTYNDLSEDNRMRGTLFLNNKFSENFGIFFAAVFDQADRIDNLAESQRLRTFEGDFEAGTDFNGTPLASETELALSTFSGVRYQDQKIPRDRETFVAGIQWQTDNLDINFDWTAGFEDEVRDDRRFWYGYGDMIRRFDNRMTSLTVDTGDENLDISDPTLGTLVAYDFAGATGSRIEPLAAGLYRYIPRSSDVNVGGLNLVWHNDIWTIEGDVGFADQKTNRVLERLRTRLDRGQARFENGVSGTYDIRSGYPIARLYDSFGVEVSAADTSHQGFNLLERTITDEEAEDVSARLDITRELVNGFDSGSSAFQLDLRFGLAWNEMTFSRTLMAKDTNSGFDLSGVGAAIGTDVLNDVNVPGFVHTFAVPDIRDPLFDDYLSDPSGYQVVQEGWFDVTEENTAFYLQGDFSGEGALPYRGNIGFRYVDTTQTNFGWVGEGEGDNFVPADPVNPQVLTERDYGVWLPSFNLAFDLSDAWIMRFAANRSMTRPDPIDLSARVEINDLEDEGDDRASGGNPNLKPYKTSSYDMLVEWYPEAGGSYALGLFHKKLDGFIASGSSPEELGVDDGSGSIVLRTFDVSRPVNTDGGTVKGAEFQFHLPFDSFSDGFWSYFGINGSYTYVDAKMDAVVPDRGTPISLRGTSEKSGNLVLYFERERFGARVAGNYRSDYLFQEASDTDRFDEWTQGRTIVDMNFDFILMENMKLRFSANNLTEERRERYWYTPGEYFSDERDNGREFVLEFRYASD